MKQLPMQAIVKERKKERNHFLKRGKTKLDAQSQAMDGTIFFTFPVVREWKSDHANTFP